MKLSVPFAELQGYVSTHYHKELKLNYVDGSTVEVATPVKVLGFTKQIGIQLAVRKIEGTDLFLACNGKMGIDLLVGSALTFVKRLVPEKTDFVQALPGNVIKIALGDIDKLAKVFDKLALENISFVPTRIEVEASLL